MALDKFSFCPCGSGKKIKYCAPAGALSEIEKIARAIQGNQRAAALASVKRLIDKHGKLTCLLGLKAQLESHLGFEDDERATVQELIAIAPETTIACLYEALLFFAEGETDKACAAFQEAMYLREATDPMPVVVREVLIGLVESFLREQKILAAVFHLNLCGALMSEDDREYVGERMAQILQAQSIPLVFKRSWQPLPPPEDVAWKGEYQTALRQVGQLRMNSACEILQSLSDKVPDEPLILRSIACLQQSLGQEDAAIDTWRRYVATRGIDQQDLIDALTLIYWLDEKSDVLEEIRLTYEVTDVDKAKQLLVQSDRALESDYEQVEDDSSSRPQVAARWLSVPLDPEQEDACAEHLAGLLLFGRETDREPRLEVILMKDRRYDKTFEELEQFFDGCLKGSPKSETTGQPTALSHMLTEGLVIAEQRQDHGDRLTRQIHQKRIEEWLEMPVDFLQGLTPLQAAEKEEMAQHLRAYYRATIGVLDSKGWFIDLDVLRHRLNLPDEDPLPAEAAKGEMFKASCTLIPGAAFDDLALDPLISLVTVIQVHGLLVSLRRLLLQLLQRDDLPEGAHREQLALQIAQLGPADEAAEMIEKAKQFAIAEGRPVGHIKMAELQQAMGEFNSDKMRELMIDLHTNHLAEPGVGEMLQEIMSMVNQTDGDIEETPAVPASSGLWTPGSPQSPSDSSDDQGPSKLWIPD